MSDNPLVRVDPPEGSPSELTALRLYSDSGVNVFKHCARQHYFSHVRKWAPVGKALPLIFGSGWHAGMDVIWRRHKEPKTAFNEIAEEAYQAFLKVWQEMGMEHPDELHPDDLDSMSPRTPFIAMEMFYNYIEARQYLFKDPSFDLISIEEPFAVPLDPEDPTLFYVGRLDKVFRYQKRVYVGEHKTTSMYRKSPHNPFRADFTDSFSPNSQIDGYLFKLNMEYGAESGGVYVDAALVHKTVHDGFTIIPVDRQFAQIDAWLWTMRSWIADIENNRAVLAERSKLDTPYLAAFPQNTTACIQYGRSCSYADICRGVGNPAKITGVPMGFTKSTWSLFDEIKLEKLGFTKDKTGEED